MLTVCRQPVEVTPGTQVTRYGVERSRRRRQTLRVRINSRRCGEGPGEWRNVGHKEVDVVKGLVNGVMWVTRRSLVTRLRKMMLEELQRRNLSKLTAECYLRAADEFQAQSRPLPRCRPCSRDRCADERQERLPRGQTRRLARRLEEACPSAHASPLLRHASTRSGCRLAHHSTSARPCGSENHEPLPADV